MSVTYLPHQGWLLTQPLDVRINEGHFTIPKGFKSDLASIPKFLRIVPGFDCYECGIDGPVVHDWGYQHGGFMSSTVQLSRRRVDEVFHKFMRRDRVGRLRAWIVWAAVRLFGWWAWRQMPSRDRALWMAQ